MTGSLPAGTRFDNEQIHERRTSTLTQIEGTQAQFNKLKAHRRNLTMISFYPCGGKMCRETCACKDRKPQLKTARATLTVLKDKVVKIVRATPIDRLKFERILNKKLDEEDKKSPRDNMKDRSKPKVVKSGGTEIFAPIAVPVRQDPSTKLLPLGRMSPLNVSSLGGLMSPKVLNLRTHTSPSPQSDKSPSQSSFFRIKNGSPLEIDADSIIEPRKDINMSPKSILRRPSGSLSPTVSFNKHGISQESEPRGASRTSVRKSVSFSNMDVLSPPTANSYKQRLKVFRKPKSKRQKLDNGLRYLGQKAYEMKEALTKEANTLYRDKVLVQRARTRDIMPPSLNSEKFRKNLARSMKPKKKDSWSGNNQVKTLIRQRYNMIDTFTSVVEASQKLENEEGSVDHRKESDEVQPVRKDPPVNPINIVIPKKSSQTRRVINLDRHLRQQDVREHLGLSAQKQGRLLRIARFTGELTRREKELHVITRLLEQKRARRTISTLFMNIYLMLKEKNKEKWAARVIYRWWRKVQVRLREIEAERWLPLNIDPETANFDDVGRVLKVLDDYALKKLAHYEGDPQLPYVIRIQRAIRSYLASSRVKRLLRDCVKVVRFRKVCSRFERRANLMQLFNQHDTIWKDEIENKRRKREKHAERQRKIDAGEAVSDSSSVKQEKQRKKDKYMAKLRTEMMTTTEELKEQKREAIAQALHKEAIFSGKNRTTIEKKVNKEEKKRANYLQKELKKAKEAAVKASRQKMKDLMAASALAKPKQSKSADKAAKPKKIKAK